MTASNGDSQIADRRLFRFEIRAAAAHCNALFRAAILTRIEAERLKNGLWTILKRADFDPNYLAQPAGAPIFEIIENRLFQLVSEAAVAVNIKRTFAHRAAIALRLWTRAEIETLIESLENLIELLKQNPENAIFRLFADALIDDCARFAEILPRVNRMPKPELAADDEAAAEIDFDLIADELDFAATIENTPENAFDADFAIEFASVIALSMLHLGNLAHEILRRDSANFIQTKRRALEAVRAAAPRVFGHHAALLALSKNVSATDDNGDFDETCRLVFDAADALQSSIAALADNLKK